MFIQTAATPGLSTVKFHNLLSHFLVEVEAVQQFEA
jgi:hypothetical protein